MVSVLLSASVERVGVSRMRDFFSGILKSTLGGYHIYIVSCKASYAFIALNFPLLDASIKKEGIFFFFPGPGSVKHPFHKIYIMSLSSFEFSIYHLLLFNDSLYFLLA